jgi:hypothetical protein
MSPALGDNLRQPHARAADHRRVPAALVEQLDGAPQVGFRLVAAALAAADRAACGQQQRPHDRLLDGRRDGLQRGGRLVDAVGLQEELGNHGGERRRGHGVLDPLDVRETGLRVRRADAD